MLAPQEAALAGDAIKVELSKAIAELTSIIKRLNAECVRRGDLPLYQRTFLLYKPANWRGWIAHILCLFFALGTLLYVIGQAADDNNEFSFTEFKNAWSQSDAYAGFFFLLGFFLIARLWGAFERRRHLALQDPSCAAPPAFPLGSVLAWVYLAAGGTSVVGGIFLFTTDLHSGVKLMLFGLPVLLSALPFSTWSNLRQGKLMNRWRTNSAFLLTPPVLLMLIVILNLGGVILAGYEHDLLAYWRRWFQEPVLPLVIFPFALAPLLTALRSLRYARRAMVSS